MKALLLSSYGHLEIADLPAPTPAAGEVLIASRPAASAAATSTATMAPPAAAFRPSSWATKPPASSPRSARLCTLPVGDRVTFDSTVYCGDCEFCRRGEINLCDNRQVLGVSCDDYRRAGAFAEFVAVPAAHPLPAARRSLLCRRRDARSRLRRAPRRPALPNLGRRYRVVVGAGMIGLLSLQAPAPPAARASLSRTLTTTAWTSPKNLGASRYQCAEDESLAEAMSRLTGGRGVDVAFEAVGATRPSQPPSTACAKAARWRWSATSRPKSSCRCRKW